MTKRQSLWISLCLSLLALAISSLTIWNNIQTGKEIDRLTQYYENEIRKQNDAFSH